MSTHYLRAGTEADLIAALPWLRYAPDGGSEQWIKDGEHHTFVPIPIMALEDAVMAEDGETIIASPVLSPHWHANLLLLETHPLRDDVLAAIGPFLVEPDHPKWVFS